MAQEENMKVKRNQFGEVVENEERMTLKDWNTRWQNGQTKFHLPKVHPTLQKYYSMLAENGIPRKKVFLPLCGKSLDLCWLAEKGHQVVGVECSSLGCQQFYEENQIPFTVQTLSSGLEGKIFKSTDRNTDVTLYCCDFFKIKSSVTGKMDCVWDRGSYAAMDSEARRRYAPIMKELLAPHGKYLLCSYGFDHTYFAGPPFASNTAEVESLYGDQCSVQLIGERDALSDWQSEWGLDLFSEEAYLITLQH